MKRSFTPNELKAINDHMMNYTVDIKVYGAKTTLKVHVGLVGNHLQIIDRLAKEQYGDNAQVLGAKITGKVWKSVNPF